MIDGGGDVGLAAEPLQVGGIAGEVAAQHLQGKNSTGLGIPRPVDDRLPASGDPIKDPVPADAPLSKGDPSFGARLVERL